MELLLQALVTHFRMGRLVTLGHWALKFKGAGQGYLELSEKLHLSRIAMFNVRKPK